jgi:prophage antirepressor-like protein
VQNLSLALSWEGRMVRMAGTPECPEWVASDVCGALGLAGPNPWRRLPATEKGKLLTLTAGGPQEVVTVKLPGLLRLILRSDKPEAQRFQAWTVGELLPSILRHGGYPPPILLAAPGSALAAFRGAVAALDEHEARIARLEAAEQGRARREGAAVEAFVDLPGATASVNQPTYGSLTEKRIRAGAFLAGENYGRAFRRFYEDSGLRLHVRLGPERRRRVLLRDAVDSYSPETASAIYNLACEMFPAVTWAARARGRRPARMGSPLARVARGAA